MHFLKMFKNPNSEEFCLLLLMSDYGCVVIQVTESMLSTKL